MSFNREKVKDFYLLSTDVENIFINEYMAAAPGDYVKVYLYGLLYSQYQADMTYKEMAKQLGLSEKQIEEAWDYWAGMGVVEKHQKSFGAGDDYDIEFKQLRSLMYGRGVESEVKKDKAGTDAPLYDSELKELLFEVESIMGKPLSAKETREVFSWVSDLEATKEVISSAIVYCLEKGKDSISYISKVIAQWTADGLKTEDDVKMRLETLEQNNA
ncbi:MAG: DnaD domain protein, partial [Anaerovoracaceae bacterium]